MRERADMTGRGPSIGPAEVADAIRALGGGIMPSTAAGLARLREDQGSPVGPALRTLADYHEQRSARTPPTPAWKIQNDRLRRKLAAAMK